MCWPRVSKAEAAERRDEVCLDDAAIALQRGQRDVVGCVVPEPAAQVFGDRELAGADVDARVPLVEGFRQDTLGIALRPLDHHETPTSAAGRRIFAQMDRDLPRSFAASADVAWHGGPPSMALLLGEGY